MSHYGTARDLRARLLHEGKNIELKTTSVSNFIVDNIKNCRGTESLILHECI